MRMNVKIYILFIILLMIAAQAAKCQQDSLKSGELTREKILSMDYDDLLDLPFEKVMEMAKIVGVSVDELFDLVVSTAGKKEEIISEIPASVIVIERKEIESYGYRRLEDILEDIVGLYGIDNLYFDGVSYGIRGFWSENANSNIVILVNGIKQTIEFSGANPLSKIKVPVEAIDRIEVIKGPISIMYGSGAFFGAINILTNEKDDNNKHNQAAFTYGNRQYLSGSLCLSDIMQDFQYSFTGAAYQTKGSDFQYSKMASALSDNRLSLTTKDKLEKNGIYFDFYGQSKNFEVDINFTHSDVEGIKSDPPFNNGSRMDLTTGNFLLSYNKNITDRFRLKSYLRYMINHYKIDYDRYKPDLYGYEEVDNDIFEYELNAFFSPSYKYKFTTGYYMKAIPDISYRPDFPYEHEPYYTNSTWKNDDIIFNHAFFFQAYYRPIERLKFVAGLRLEYNPDYSFHIKYAYDPLPLGRNNYFYRYDRFRYSPDRIEIIPRVAMIYSLTDKHVAKLLYGKGFKNPSFESVSKNMSLGLDIESEYIETFELNYAANFSHSFKINSSLFFNNLDNLISRTNYLNVDSTQEYSILSNVGELKSYGSEFIITTVPFSDLTIDMGLTIQKTIDQREGFEDISREFSPHLYGNIKIKYAIDEKYIFSLTGNYTSSMETHYRMVKSISDIQPDVPFQSYNGRIGQKTGDVVLLDANIRMNNLFNSKLYFNTRINNILNSTSYYPTTTLSKWADKGTLREYFRVWVTAGYKF